MSDPKLRASAHSVSVIRSIDLKKVRWRKIQELSTPSIVLLIFFMTWMMVLWVTLRCLLANPLGCLVGQCLDYEDRRDARYDRSTNQRQTKTYRSSAVRSEMLSLPLEKRAMLPMYSAGTGGCCRFRRSVAIPILVATYPLLDKRAALARVT